MKKSICICAAMCTLSGTAVAGEVFNQGFETDTAGWNDYAGGTIVRVASGTGSISSSGGSNHAIVDATGPYTAFDGYRNAWTGGFTASADIYLDTNWNPGEGFSYSVAANGSDGNHQRDFIFHITANAAGDGLLVGANNNSNVDGTPISNTNVDAPNSVFDSMNTITQSGWYTFEHVFYDFGDGTLAVDLNLFDSSNNLVFTETRHNSSDILGSEVGGNRYGWFTAMGIGDGLALDNVTLTVVPLPPAAFAGLGLLAGCAGVRQYRRR